MPKKDQHGSYVKCVQNGKSTKKVPIVIGGLYIVEPMSPLRKKYRGEKVLLVEAEYMEIPKVLRIESEWHVKRKSYTDMDICDLKYLTKDLPEDIAELLG